MRQLPGLDKWLIDSEQDGIAYRVTVSKEKATEENVAPLLMPFSDKEVFSITPVIAGAEKDGFGAFLLGAALITAAVFLAPAASAGGGFFTAGAANTTLSAMGYVSLAVGNLGISLVLGGIAQAISPQPDTPSIDEAVQLESFTFSNVVNTSRQGLPCPIAYGRVFVGSAVLSSGLDVDQLQVGDASDALTAKLGVS